MASITPVINQFSPPGGLQDFNEQQKTDWHVLISTIFDQTVKGYTQWPPEGPPKYKIANKAPRPQFFNPTKVERAPDYVEKVISWDAFPKQVTKAASTDKERWHQADHSRDVQDEYCEWSVTRENGKITSVSFTCEGPEYWKFLGKTDPKKVLKLYQEFNPGKEIKESDLFAHGKYIPRNKWNTDTKNGAMHLVQESNTLFAEIELAGGASMVREKDGVVVTDQQVLIDCGGYGEPGRNSDPFIGSEVNSLTRAGARVSLRDPVGLYFDEFNPLGWETPDGSDPKQYWKFTRGKPGTYVRATYEVPTSKRFTVSDITIKGKPIEYGSQIADFIRIKLVGVAQDIGKVAVTKFGCVEYTKVAAAALDLPASEDSKPSWRSFP